MSERCRSDICSQQCSCAACYTTGLHCGKEGSLLWCCCCFVSSSFPPDASSVPKSFLWGDIWVYAKWHPGFRRSRAGGGIIKHIPQLGKNLNSHFPCLLFYSTSPVLDGVLVTIFGEGKKDTKYWAQEVLLQLPHSNVWELQ